MGRRTDAWRTNLRLARLPGETVEKAVATGSLTTLNVLTVVQEQTVMFQLGNGGVNPGA
jgi:hypothetical protein